jgi:hypothetical protein
VKNASTSPRSRKQSLRAVFERRAGEKFYFRNEWNQDDG